MTRYDLAYLALAPLAGSVLVYKRMCHGKYRESAPAMFGRRLHQEPSDLWRKGSVWVHAVSVGEVIAAKAMLPLLRKQFPGLAILLTTHTETGQAQARSLDASVVDAVRFFPVDLSWVVQRFVQTYRPRIFICMETELWPNAIELIAAGGAKIFVLNGKISARSFRSYYRFRSILRRPLSRVSAFCMQTAADVERIAALSGSPDRIHLTGNCKFDALPEPLSDDSKALLRRETGLSFSAPAVIAGSTHQGEEEIVLRAWKTVLSKLLNPVLLLAPRHPERFNQAWEVICGSGIPARRLSDGTRSGSGDERIILIDRMGILSRLYAVGSAAIVCGSLVPGIGGHNLLEAATHGVPVLYGPYMEKQPDMVRILSADHGGTQTSEASLAQDIIALLTDQEKAESLGGAAQAAANANKGSAARNMEIITRYL